MVVSDVAEGIVCGMMVVMWMMVWMMRMMHHGTRINVEILLVLEYDSIGCVLQHLIVFVGIIEVSGRRMIIVQIASILMALNRVQIQLGCHHRLVCVLDEEVRLVRSVYVERRIHTSSSLSGFQTLVERRKGTGRWTVWSIIRSTIASASHSSSSSSTTT